MPIMPEFCFPAEVTERAFFFPQAAASYASLDLFVNTAIVGERKSGKSSDINYRRDVLADQGITSDILDHHMEPKDMAEHILEKICLMTRGITLHQTNYLQRYPLTSPSSLTTRFQMILNELWSAKPDFRLMLFIDELEHIVKLVRGINLPLLELLSSLLKSDPARKHLRLTFTLNQWGDTFKDNTSSFDSASFKLVELRPLNDARTRTFVEWLVRDHCNLDDDAHRVIFEQGGGRYFFTKGILDALFGLYADEPEGFTFGADHLREASLRSIRHHEVALVLENIWKTQFVSEERQVAEWCVDGFGRDDAKRSSKEYQDALSNLVDRYYVHWDEGRGAWVHTHGVIAEWRRLQPSYIVKQLKPQAEAALVAPPAGAYDKPTKSATMPLVSATVYSLERLPRLMVDDIAKQATLAERRLQLGPKHYKVLAYLAEHEGKTVDYNEIAFAVWPEHNGDVRDDMINGAVAAARKEVRRILEEILGDQATEKQIEAAKDTYIVTRFGFGYVANKDLVVYRTESKH